MRLFRYLIATTALLLSCLDYAQADWQKVLSCDSGKVWVDQNTTDNTQIQLVIRDPSANHFINSAQVGPTSSIANDIETTFTMKKTGDLSSVAGVSTFGEALAVYRSTKAIKVGDDYMNGFTNVAHAFRDADGIQIDFARTDLSICYYYDPTTSTCEGGRTYSVRDRFVGNWRFSNCQSVASFASVANSFQRQPY